MSARSTKRSPGYPYPLARQVRPAALTDGTSPRLQEPPAPPQPGVGEGAFQDPVVDLVERFRWPCWHDDGSRRNDAGPPDLLPIRERLSAERRAWGNGCYAAGRIGGSGGRVTGGKLSTR